MAWIELHQTLPRHPKLFRLAARLRISRAQAAGHLTFLWLWTLDYAPTGDLSAFGPAELSAAADFGGDAELFAQALRETGWLDEGDQIHDWDEYAGKLIEGREQAKTRMREFRKRQREGNVGKRSDELRERADTLRERSELPYSTVPYSTEPEIPKDSPPPSDLARTNAAKRRPASAEEVVTCGALLGVSPEDCRAWWSDMEATGWAKVDGTPFGNWRRELSIHRDRMRERGEVRKLNGGPNAPQERPSAFTLKTQLEAIDSEIKSVTSRGHEDAFGWQPKNEDDRKRMGDLKKKRREVNAKLAEIT